MTTKLMNWWVFCGVVVCVIAWAIGVLAVTKTANLYAHPSDIGFRREVIEHARGHWLSVKRILAPGSM